MPDLNAISTNININGNLHDSFAQVTDKKINSKHLKKKNSYVIYIVSTYLSIKRKVKMEEEIYILPLTA